MPEQPIIVSNQAVLSNLLLYRRTMAMSRSQIVRDAERARRLLDGMNDSLSIKTLRSYADELDSLLRERPLRDHSRK